MAKRLTREQQELKDDRASARRRAEENDAARRNSRGTGTAAVWMAVDPPLLHQLVDCVTEAGHLVSFGKTRDGGALYLQIYTDGKSVKHYIRPTDNCSGLIRDILHIYGVKVEVQLELPL